MARTVRSSLKLLLKLVNAGLFGALGLLLLVFGFWVLRVWYREVADGSISSSYPLPWFVYASIGIGVGLCLMTFIGHFAADTANPLCLSFYLGIIFVLMLLEIAFSAYVFMNSAWEKDLPQDPTGMLDDLADYIDSHSLWFRWVGLSLVFAQVVSVLLVIMLRNDEAQYGVDEDRYIAQRVPLLHNPSHFFDAEPSSTGQNDQEAWKLKCRDEQA